MRIDYFVYAFDTIAPKGGMNDFQFRGSHVEELLANIKEGDEWSAFQVLGKDYNHIQVVRLDTGQFIQVSRFCDIKKVIDFLKSRRLGVKLEARYLSKKWGKLVYENEVVAAAGETKEEVVRNLSRRLIELGLVPQEDVHLISFQFDS